MARRELGPATLQLVQAVADALGPADSTLLVACSGGPDSLALAAAVRRVGRTRGLPCAAVVVNHQLQAGAAATADRTAAQLRSLDYDDVVVHAVTVSPSGEGLEGAARAARYAALDQQAVARDATVLLGHTLDDQAETVLLGLARGSGSRSLSGMALRNGRLLRPLLGVRRATTAACCSELGISPWRDPHNGDLRFSRARLRTRVMPMLEAELGPGIAEALARTAELVRDDVDLLDRLAADLDAGTGGSLDCAQLAALPTALRRRLLRAWLLDAGASDLAMAHLIAVDRLVMHWRGQRGVDVPGGVVRRVADHLHLEPRPSRAGRAGVVDTDRGGP